MRMLCWPRLSPFKRYPQACQPGSGMQLQQLATRHPLDVPEPADDLAMKQGLGVGACEGVDHGAVYSVTQNPPNRTAIQDNHSESCSGNPPLTPTARSGSARRAFRQTGHPPAASSGAGKRHGCASRMIWANGTTHNWLSRFSRCPPSRRTDCRHCIRRWSWANR